MFMWKRNCQMAYIDHQIYHPTIFFLKKIVLKEENWQGDEYQWIKVKMEDICDKLPIISNILR